MPELRVVVQDHLGVERQHPAVGGDGERVDLGQRAIGIMVQAPQLEQHLRRLRHEPAVAEQRLEERAGLEGPDAIERHRTAHDPLRAGAGHLLDVHAALGRQHDERELAPAIQHDRQVELASDVRGLGHEHAAHRQPLDGEGEDLARLVEGLVGSAGELDAPGLASTAHLDLGLHHHRAPDRGGDVPRLLGRGRDLPGQHRQAEAREQLLGLVLVKVH